MSNENSIYRRIFKIITRLLVLTVVLLILSILLIIFTPAIQTIISHRIAAYYSTKLKTEIKIDRLAIRDLNSIELNNILIADKNKDTILHCKKVKIDIILRSIVTQHIKITNIEIDSLTSKIYNTTHDSCFNYQFILNEFPNKNNNKIKTKYKSNLNIITNKIELKNIRILFQNRYKNINHITHINNLRLNNLHINTKNSTYSSNNFIVSGLNYQNNIKKDSTTIASNSLSIIRTNINTAQNKVDIESIYLNKSNITYSINTRKELTADKNVHSDKSRPLHISAKNIILKDNEIKYDNNIEKNKNKSFDQNHLIFRDIHLQATNIKYTPTIWNVYISNFSFKERSGLALKKMSLDLNLNNKILSINKLAIATQYSSLKLISSISNFNPLATSTDSKKIAVKLIVDTLKLGYADLMLLNKNIKRGISRAFSRQSILINTKLEGTLANIHIANFTGKTGSSTTLNIQGSISGLPNIKHIVYKIDQIRVRTSKKDISTLGNDFINPNIISVPQKIEIIAKGSGTSRSFYGEIKTETPDGNLLISPQISNISNPKRLAYDIAFETRDINVGKIVKKDSTIGRVALNGWVKGSGLPMNGSANFEINIHHLDLKRYRYQNISLNGNIEKNQINHALYIADTNLSLSSKGSVLINQLNSHFDNKICLRKLNLQPIGLSTTPMSIASNINIQFNNFNIDSLSAKVYTDSLILTNSGKSIKIDTLLVMCDAEKGNRSIEVNTDFIDAIIVGNFQLSKIEQASRYILSNYLPNIMPPATSSMAPQDFVFLISSKHLYNLKKILPDINEIQPILIRADLNTAEEMIKIDGDIPKISYGTIDFSKGRLTSDLKNGEGEIKFGAEKLITGNISVFNPKIELSKKKDQLNFNLTTQDSLYIGTLYQIGANFNFNKTKINASFSPEFILNGDSWEMNPANKIEVDTTGLLIHNFKLSRGRQNLIAESIDKKPNNPVRLNFEKFRIKTITNIAGLDTTYFRGVINGQITVHKLNPSPILAANITISNTVFQKNLLGDLSINAQNLNQNEIGANISLKGNGNDIQMQASYQTKFPNEIKSSVNINDLNIKLIEPLTGGFFVKSSGKVSGHTFISGTTISPKIYGEINLKNTAAMIAPFNSFVKFKDERIQFTQEGIKFNKFTILDSSENKFTINGLIATNNYRDYKLDLSINSRGFEIVRKKENEKSLVYGPVWIDADAKISGNTNLPKITATTTILPKSKLTIILPESAGGVSSSQGVVEFMDSLNINKTVILDFSAPDSAKVSKFKGIDLNANIAIDKDAELVLRLSPNSGDVIDVQGDAKLNATIDPSGKFSFAGKYEIKKGYYDLNFNGLMQRKFDIKEGSSITWRGAPTDADVNITASYKVKAAPIDLMADKMTDVDPSKLSTYKQKQDFLVYLIVKGDMLKPDISFKIDMPEESKNALDGNVFNLIKELNQQETEQKKQVASLLLLGRFVANNPFVSLAGSSAESTIRESASRILTDQLNSLADDLISGVDLDFNLESKEDFSTGESKNQTNLSVGISKNIGDRISVYVGSNFELESADPNASKNNIAGDVAVEYKLTKDGRYRIKVFRKNEYEAVIAGEVVETGLTFSLTMNYNKFRELFKRVKERNQKK